MLLPWLTFMVLYTALYVRMIRANVIETMSEDYVRTARAKGASESTVMRRHVLRNVMLPVVTILGMDIGLALGGAIFTETVYSLPGLGRTSVQALANYDVPTVLGVIVFATVVIIIFNLVVDILYAWIDPRIRLA
jgi:peptide/nickel transport system permease protein